MTTVGQPNELRARGATVDDMSDSSHAHNFPSDSDFEALVILEFSPKSNQAAREWLTAKLQGSKLDNGAELTVRTNFMEHTKETLLYIGASTERLLIGAEEIKLKKTYSDGTLKDITLTDLDNFSDSEDLECFLTRAEKQSVVIRGIEAVRANTEETHIPGYPKILLYPGKSIIKKFLSRHIVTNLYPLHDEEEIKELGNEWYTLPNYFKQQPIEKIRKYFGVKIALYFSFLGIYTLSLAPPALIGLVYFLYPWASVYREATFAIFNLVWSTIFLEAWKRYCNALCFKWGTIDSSTSFSHVFEEPRANYYGTMGHNAVTGNPEPVYPKWKRVVKFYLVSLPLVSLCLTGALCAMLAYFWAEAWIKKNGPKDLGVLTTVVNLIPTVIYAVVIGVLNGIYRLVAVKLNKYENHRLQSSYDNHLILKLLLFDFVNCFICLFYVAFYLQDRELLKTFLGTVLVTQQIVGQIQEAMVPFLFMQRRQTMVDQALQRAEGAVVVGADVSREAKKRAALEGQMERWPGSNYEYLEMYLQFGYVYLFSSAFPLAALWALLNNIIEIRSDAFKMCRVFQRPFAEQARSIGAWQPAFEVIGLISVITNCALVGMDPQVQKLFPSNISAVNLVLLFVAAEHVVLAIKASVALLIPDVPKWVTLQMARQEYLARMALRKHRLMEASQKKKVVAEALLRRSTLLEQ